MRQAIGRDNEARRLARVLVEDGPRGFVISGPPGVGKSRLLSEVADEAARRAWVVERLAAGRAIRAIPFGLASHLLPPDLGSDLVSLAHTIRAALRERAGEQGLLLAVDDAHELDDYSAALVHQLVVHEEARLLMTTRTAAEAPAPVTQLWKDGWAQRLDLEPLSRPATERLAGDVLGGPLAEDLRDGIWDLSLGVPLYVVVALEEARDAGAVAAAPDGSWRLVDSLVSARLHDLVSARIAELDDEARAALEAIAVAGPIRRRHLSGLVDEDTFERVRTRGLITMTPIRGDVVVSAVHPVYADVVFASLAPGRFSAIVNRLIDTITADPSADGDDRIRAGVWMLDGARPVDAALVSAAAREAVRRFDYPLAERLATAALAAQPESVAPAVSLAQALGFRGRGEEALKVLDEVRPASPEEIAEVALAQGHLLAFVLGRPGKAAAALDEAAAHLPDLLRWHVDAERALYGAIAGDFTATFHAATSVLAAPDVPPHVRATAYVNRTLAESMTGRVAGVDEDAEAGLRLAREHASELPLAVDQIEMNLATAWSAAGRLEDVEQLCRRMEGAGNGATAANPMWSTWLGLVLGMRGRLEEAMAAGEQSIEEYARADPFRLRSQAVGMAIVHRAQAGLLRGDDADALREAAEDAGEETRLAVWADRARAWMTAATDLARAARRACDAGERAIRRDHVVWGTWALYDAVRFGHPEVVRDALAAAVEQTSGALLLEAMRDHAIGLAAGDARALESVATRMVRYGSPLYAAEAFCGAARAWEDGRASRRAAVRAQVLLRRCSAVATPALRDLSQELSERELEIAELAVTRTSRSIAKQLFLSVRTVENHLHAVYGKLELSGRDELRSLLALSD